MVQPATVGGERARCLQRAGISRNDRCRLAQITLDGPPDDLTMLDTCLRYRARSAAEKIRYCEAGGRLAIAPSLRIR